MDDRVLIPFRATPFLPSFGTPYKKMSMFEKPNYVKALQTAYGAPSQAGFGSAVFFESLQPSGDLAEAALAKYRYFVGNLWERWGEEAWMGSWRTVYTRPVAVVPDIVSELRSIADAGARQSASMILDTVEDSQRARVALSAAYDDSAVTELVVYNIGDGEAMSGILIAARRQEPDEATFLVFLMD